MAKIQLKTLRSSHNTSLIVQGRKNCSYFIIYIRN